MWFHAIAASGDLCAAKEGYGKGRGRRLQLGLSVVGVAVVYKG